MTGEASNEGSAGGDFSNWEPELEELRRREDLVERMGGPEKVARQHERGKLDVRQRIEALVDGDSFHEIGKIAGSPTYDDNGELVDLRSANFLFGRARLDGRAVVVAADDFTEYWTLQLAKLLRLRPPRGDGLGVCVLSGSLSLLSSFSNLL